MVEEIQGRPTAMTEPKAEPKVEAETNPGAKAEADDDMATSERQGERIGAAERLLKRVAHLLTFVYVAPSSVPPLAEGESASALDDLGPYSGPVLHGASAAPLPAGTPSLACASA